MADGSRMHAQRSGRGFTLLEMMVVVAIVGLLVAIAVPAWQDMRADQRLRSAARSVGDAVDFARARAILEERNFLVYLGTTSSTDACGNPLVDAQGDVVPILVLDAGAPGSLDCCIDPGETELTEPAVPGVNWGATLASSAPAQDQGGGNFSTGSSFTEPAGSQARWVLFRPDGIPVALDGSSCTAGSTGTGAGGVYVTNGNRDHAVLVSALGTVKMRSYDPALGSWTQ